MELNNKELTKIDNSNDPALQLVKTLSINYGIPIRNFVNLKLDTRFKYVAILKVLDNVLRWYDVEYWFDKHYDRNNVLIFDAFDYLMKSKILITADKQILKKFKYIVRDMFDQYYTFNDEMQDVKKDKNLSEDELEELFDNIETNYQKTKKQLRIDYLDLRHDFLDILNDYLVDVIGNELSM